LVCTLWLLLLLAYARAATGCLSQTAPAPRTVFG